MLLEEKHFDESYMNPYFVYYLRANNLKPGDETQTYQFQLWASEKHSEYAAMFGKDYWTPPSQLPGGHEAFGKWLKSLSETIAEPEQLSLFD